MTSGAMLGRKGFTLIEMAIVTVIIGIMAWGFMNFMEEYIAREKIEEGRRTAETAVEEVQGFMLGNTGKLPQPRTGNLLPLDIRAHKDPWGNDLRYWRADELDGVAVDDVQSTDLYIRYFANAADLASLSSPTRTIENVAYVVLSHGKDGRQSFTQTSGSIYINMLEDGAPTSDGGNFDDLLQYKTLPQLRTTMSASGVVGANQVASPDVANDSALSIKGGVAETGPDGLLSDSTYVAAGADVGVVTNTGVGSGQAVSMGGGEDDYIDISADTNDYAFATYTIMCWFKTDEDYDPSGTNNFGVITSRQASTSARNWWLTIWGGGWQDDVHSSGEMGFRAGNGYDLGSGDFGIRVDDEQWHFVAISVRKNAGNKYDAELYLDGQVVDSVLNRASPPPHGQNYSLFIGAGTYDEDRRFQGLIDEFYIFGSLTEDQSLSSAEVDAYYQAVKADFGY